MPGDNSRTARVFDRPSTDPRAIVADGYGVKICVQRGHLVVEDGVGRTRRTRTYPKTDRTLERIVVLAADGMVSLDAASWCADRNVVIVGACRDELGFTTRLLAGAPIAADPRLSRALVLAGRGAPWEPTGTEITKALLNVKLQGQAHIARDYLGDAEAAGFIDLAVVELDRAATIAAAESVEGRAADVYWSAWSGRVVPTWKAGGSSVPPTWRQPFAKRKSPIQAGTNRHACDPANALLNYAYSIAETVCVLACWKTGLDPALGVSHVPTTGRYSLALDLIETIRPEADKLVLGLLSSLRAEWFNEVRIGPYAGSCRVLPPLTHQIAERMGEWGKRAERHAGRIAAALTACAASNPLGTMSVSETASSTYRPVTVTLDTAPRDRKKIPDQTLALVPDDLWERVRPLIPEQPDHSRRRPVHPRRVVAALLWTHVLGYPWRSAEDGAGLNHRSMSNHLRQWRADGTWDRVRPVLEAHASAGAAS